MIKQVSCRNDVLPLKNILYRLALRITLNSAEAEDIVQDTLIKVWNKRDSWAEIESIEAFSITVCRNLALDRISKHDNHNASLDEQGIDRQDTAYDPYERTQQRNKVELVRQIIVSLPDGRTVKGKVLGADAVTDLAVVKIDADNLTVATFGDSDTLQVGEPAIAIGNPLGLEFRGSVTAGVISALNRSIEVGERKFNLIQTDAAINPGNSGGALVNADGEVVGINSAKVAVSGVEGIGFAIPINTAKPILQELAERGRVARPYLGASLMDQEIANRYGFEINLHGGIFLVKVVPGSPAAKADIRPGDIILSFNGNKVKTALDLRTALSKCKVGDRAEVTIMRNGQRESRTVVLEEVPKDYGN